MTMKRITKVGGALAALALLTGCGASSTGSTTDWRDEIQSAYAEENDQTVCETTIFGGPEESKALITTIAAGMAGDKTITELAEEDNPLSGLGDDDESTNSPEFDARMDEVVESIPGDTPAMEVMTVAIDAMFAVCEDAPEPNASDGPEVSSGVGSKDATADVTVQGKKASTEYGITSVPVRVTNNSEEASDYAITVAAESKDGSEQYETTFIYIDRLRPGQSTTEDATFFDEVPADAVFILTEVQRTASI